MEKLQKYKIFKLCLSTWVNVFSYINSEINTETHELQQSSQIRIRNLKQITGNIYYSLM